MIYSLAPQSTSIRAYGKKLSRRGWIWGLGSRSEVSTTTGVTPKRKGLKKVSSLGRVDLETTGEGTTAGGRGTHSKSVCSFSSATG